MLTRLLADEGEAAVELERRVLPYNDGATLDVHISNVRRKIGDGFIRTVRGVGYLKQREIAR